MKRIFVHGLGQSPAVWEKTILLLGSGEEAVCPDLSALVRGREAVYGNLYEAFSGFCGGFDGPISLCGLSLGGVLALHYAAAHPENVGSLVLIAAQYKMPKGLLRLQNALFRLTPKSMFRRTGFEKGDFLRLCSSMEELDFTSRLSGVTCPALILCGERDAANRKASAELAGILPNARLQELQGAGHEVNADAPEALAEALRGFYKGE